MDLLLRMPEFSCAVNREGVSDGSFRKRSNRFQSFPELSLPHKLSLFKVDLVSGIRFRQIDSEYRTFDWKVACILNHKAVTVPLASSLRSFRLR